MDWMAFVLGEMTPNRPMGTLKHLSSVRRRANVRAGFHVKMSGKPINVRRIARTRTNAIHRTVWITVVQHAAPDQK